MTMFAKKEKSEMLVIAKQKPEEREELNAAHAARQEAEISLKKAHLASGTARVLLDAAVRQVEDAEASEMREAGARFEEMKAAVLAGTLPTIAASDKARARTAVAYAVRRQAAEAAVADLVAEEGGAEADLARANEAVTSAIRSLVLAEAERVAERWAEVEAEARRIRILLGRDGDLLSRIPGFSQRLGRAFYQNNIDDGYGHAESAAAREPWVRFGADLILDPNAKLDFADADRALETALKDRADRREADERFVARLRGVAA
jgi:hypothetical protein